MYIPQTVTNVYTFQQKIREVGIKFYWFCLTCNTSTDRRVACEMVEPVTFGTQWCATGCYNIILREVGVSTEVQGKNSDLPCFYVPCYSQSDSVNAEFWQMKLTGQTIINNVLCKWLFTWAPMCVTSGYGSAIASAQRPLTFTCLITTACLLLLEFLH
jgi:hypothetical protein